MLTPRSRVAIIGAGPAGLVLAHLLRAANIETTVIDRRSRSEIEQPTGVVLLEPATVELLSAIPRSRARQRGSRQDGFELLFEGSRHRIDHSALVGRSIWLYNHHELLSDLLSALTDAGQEFHFETTVTRIDDLTQQRPRVIGLTPEGTPFERVADFVVGADGSRSVVRSAIESGSRRPGIFRGYPFAWYAVSSAAPPLADELIYANSEDGFALIGQGAKDVQRMYFQCDPATPRDAFNDDTVWKTLRRRTQGIALQEGPILGRDVLRFRSFVSGAMRYGNAALVGDAAHSVPLTGGKSMNLAVSDANLLSEALRMLFLEGDERGMTRYEEVAMGRVWRAQQFSWWMTQLLHVSISDSPFERFRRRAELRALLDSGAGRTYLAEQYTESTYTRLV